MLKKGGVRVLASLRVENCRSQKHGRSDDITFKTCHYRGHPETISFNNFATTVKWMCFLEHREPPAHLRKGAVVKATFKPVQKFTFNSYILVGLLIRSIGSIPQTNSFVSICQKLAEGRDLCPGFHSTELPELTWSEWVGTIIVSPVAQDR